MNEIESSTRTWMRLGVSRRTANALVRSNLYTPHDVLALGSLRRLLCVRHIGKVAVRDVLYALADYLPWRSS